MRTVLVLAAIVGCAHAPPYRISVEDKYEVGEDATVTVNVSKVTDDDAELIVTRPDGTIVKQHAPLDATSARIKFGKPPPHPGTPPTFTVPGTYTIELRADDNVLAKQEILVEGALLDELLPVDEIADYTQITRYTRTRQHGKKTWKVYGAIYVLARNVDARIEIIIENPGKNLEAAWKEYEEEGTISVIEGNNVRFRERTGSVSTSWISGKRIINTRGPTLADLEKGLIAHFLGRFPSKLASE